LNSVLILEEQKLFQSNIADTFGITFFKFLLAYIYYFFWLSDIWNKYIYTGINVSSRVVGVLEIVKRYVCRVFLNCLFSKDSLSHFFFMKMLSDLMWLNCSQNLSNLSNGSDIYKIVLFNFIW